MSVRVDVSVTVCEREDWMCDGVSEDWMCDGV